MSLELSDDEIIEEVLSGKIDSFELLAERHRQLVFGIASRRVPAEDVEETAHEIFIRVYRSLSGFRGESDFSHWLSAIAVRTCCDYWRERYRSKELPMNRLSEKHRNWINGTLSSRSGSSFLREEEKRTAREIVMYALNRLSPKDRAVVELVHLEGRPVKEAADLLDWSVSNVKVRAFRARKKLRRVIESIADREGE